MAGKPGEKPTWASQTQTTPQGGLPPRRQLPDGAHQTQGWSFGEKPAHETFNWWMYNVAEWVDYLDGLSAADISATGGQSVQTALNNINATNNSQQTAINALVTAVTAMPTADSIGLRELKKPLSTAVGQDAWSSITGNVMYNGQTWPDSAAAGVTTWGPLNEPFWNLPTDVYTGRLVINGDTVITALRSPQVLRVHGDLVLNGPLSFRAQRDAHAVVINVDPWNTPVSKHSGGCGVWAEGGGLASHQMKFHEWGPHPVYSPDSYRRQLIAARGVGGVLALAPMLRGGGSVGGGGFYRTKVLNAYYDYPENIFADAGGAAILLVSGDILVGPNGSIRCNGADATPLGPPAANNTKTHYGPGGGGGGALFVFCGGRVLTTGGNTSLNNVFQAKGGRGADITGYYPGAYSGCGGGGGYVYLCGRNVDSAMASAEQGYRGWAASATVGFDGNAGATHITKAVPSRLF